MKKYYITLMILMISLISNAIECNGLKRTADKYWETDNLINAIQVEYGTDYTIGDWLDLKALPDIDEWIMCMELVDDDQFILTRDGEYIYSGNRQYFVQYFADGNVPGSWLVHDQIGNKLFLGSWFDIEMSILALNTEPPFMLTSPNGGEYWKWDTQHLINWTTNDSIIENVNIWLSLDSGNSYPDLLFENTANDGEEPWTIPEAQCNTARIKIEGYDAEGELVAEDESNGDFFIYTTPPIDLDSGLVAYYPFNGNAKDESENDNNGDVYSATLSNDRFGDDDKAYSFDGVDDCVVIPDNPSFDVMIEFTLEAWVKTSGSSSLMRIIDRDIYPGASWTLFKVDDNRAGFAVRGNNGGTLQIYSISLLNDNDWHHVVGTFNDGEYKIYFDGSLEGNGISEAAGFDVNSGVMIGAGTFISYQHFEGTIDEVRIYNRALNDFEVQALYHEGDWKIKPSFVTELNDQIACKNDSIAFEAIVEGVTPIHYQWQKDGIDLPDATDSILIIPLVLAEDDGEYRCTATNDHGSGTSNTATLSVEFALPTIISGFTSVHEYQVSTYSADMQEGHTYEFVVEGGNVIDGTENSVTVHWGIAGQGFISLIERSDLGCSADTNTLEVTIGYLGIDDLETQNLSIYPNPFSTSTTIEYESTQHGKVEIKIFNQMGELIEIIQKITQPGKQTFTWDANDLPNGIYFIRILLDNELITKKIIKM